MNKMLCLTVTVLWVLMLPAAFAQDPPTLEAELRDVLVIGDDETAPRAYLLGHPITVRSGTDGRIYIADRASMHVKVYSASGEHVATVGEQGQGPGEFQHLTAIHVDRSNRLVVADNMNARITRFTPEYEVAETIPMDRDVMMWPRDIQQLPTGEYVILYKMPQEPTDMFHVFSEALDEELARFGPFEDQPQSGVQFVQQRVQVHPGRFDIDASGNVTYAPHHYAGELLSYERSAAEPLRWGGVERMKGHVLNEDAFTPLDTEPYPDEAVVIHGPLGTSAALVHNTSMGVFVMRDGSVVHFSVMQDGDERIFGVELFDPNDALRGYARLDTLDATMPPYALEVAWKDEDDRFYLLDLRSYPVLRVVELEYARPDG